MKRLNLLFLCVPMLAAPIGSAVGETFSAYLQPKVVAVDETDVDGDGLPDSYADIPGGYDSTDPDDFDGGTHNPVTRDDLVAQGAEGWASFTLGEEGGSSALTYSISVSNLNYADVDAILINVGTKTNGIDDPQTGLPSRTGVPLFGIIGPDLSSGMRFDRNGVPRKDVEPVIDGDDFTLTGIWNFRDWALDEAAFTFAFDLDDWVDELQEGLLYLEIYTDEYPYWASGFPNPDGSIYQDSWPGGALRGTITAAAPTADVMSLLAIGMLGWGVSRRSRKPA
jgi:hypothetical protein